jgi:hypothetical protein
MAIAALLAWHWFRFFPFAAPTVAFATFVAAINGIMDVFDNSAAVGLAVDYNVLPQTHR